MAHPPTHASDSLRGLAGFFRRGHFHGHGRVFWMNTDNRSGLVDYYALAIGAGIGYQTPRIARHLEVGMSGFFMFNVLSSDLLAADPRTGKGSRYEVGLFNLTKPNNHEDLDRLEELYVRYHFGHSSRLTIGRQLPASPFVNPQDGRMRPTLTEGIVLEWQEWKQTRLRAEYLVRVSPRSTVEWFTIGESIGLLPGGITTTGKPAQYAGHVRADKLLILGLNQQLGRWQINLWDTWVPGLFHTGYGQAEWHQPLGKAREWWIGGQVTRQWAVGNGGHDDTQRAYLEPGARSLVLSAQAGYRTPHWRATLNTTRITAEGRYLMPREWGREPFYTFMPRERNEGLGDVWAVMSSLQYKINHHWTWELATGLYQTPPTTHARLNKYSLPSYSQLNLRGRYHWTGLLNGLDAELLLVRKGNLSGDTPEDRIAQNRVSMSQVNLVLNYHY